MRATYQNNINTSFEIVQKSIVDYVLFCLRGGAATSHDVHQKSFGAQLNVVHPVHNFTDHFQFSRLLHSLLMIPPVFISYICTFNYWKSLCLTMMPPFITIYGIAPLLYILNIPFLNPGILLFMATVQLAYSLFLHAPFDHRNSLFLKLLTGIGISTYALCTMSSGAITISLFGMLHFSIMPLTLTLCSALYAINALCYAIHLHTRDRIISEPANWEGFMHGQTSYLNAVNRRRTAMDSPGRPTLFDTVDPMFSLALFLSKTFPAPVQFFHPLSLPAMVNDLILMPLQHMLLQHGWHVGDDAGLDFQDDPHTDGNSPTIQKRKTPQNQNIDRKALTTPSAHLSSNTSRDNTPITDVDSHTPFPLTPTHKNTSENRQLSRTERSLQHSQRSTSARSDRTDSTQYVSGISVVITSPVTVENFDHLSQALSDHSDSLFVAQFCEQLYAHLENSAYHSANYESIVNVLDRSLPSLSSSQLSTSGEDAQPGLFGRADRDVQIITLASEYLQSHKNTFKSDVQTSEAAHYSLIHRELVTLIVTITRQCHTNDSVDLAPIIAMVMAAPEKVSARICHYNNDNFLNESNDPAKFCFFALLAYSGYLISVHTHNDDLKAHSCSKLNAICTQIAALQSTLPNFSAVVRNYQPSKLIESVQQLTNLVNSSAAHQSSSIS